MNQEVVEKVNVNSYLITNEELKANTRIFANIQRTSEMNTDVVYASLKMRMAAYLIDLFVVAVLFMLLYISIINSNFFLSNTLWNRIITGLVLWTFYYGIFEGSILQATPGKILCKLKVTDKHGQRIGFIRSLLRFLASFLSILPVGFGIWDLESSRNSQTWHDRLFGCCVVRIGKNKGVQ